MSPIRGNKRKEFVKQDFDAVVNIRWCVLLKTRHEELTQSCFVGQPLTLEVYKKKLKPITGGQSKKTGRRLRVDI
jgi:hypothetical protein